MSELFSPVWSGRAALLTSAVLALLIVWLFVRMVWLVLGGVQVDSAPVPPVPRVAPTSGDSGEFRWDLFGAGPSRPAVVRAAPATGSSLRLKGVVTGEHGYAVIAGNGGGDEVYRVGDELPGGGELEAIEPRRVLIARNGRTESLAIDPDSATPSSGRGPANRPTGERGVQVEARLPGIQGLQSPTGISAASLPDIGSSLGINASQLAGAISVMPVAGGGFRVRPGRDARLFGELGLQVNDIVTAVNGQPLESEQAVQRLFSEVLGSGEVSITVRRQGREVTLRPDLEQIMGSLEKQ